MKTVEIFKEDYDYESLYDLSEQIEEALDETTNKVMKKLPKDKHQYILGTFHVNITWTDDKEE